ncbi:unnamed protein product [Blepharisma stoltei]|uniref:Enoyl reductase (ER) domain-containing protein n=1 Tax=Blepharisma stoltei TaxID=1481888 RepID=A0AAU9K2X1_9CILI|nr:unnamed protein product [Blepharisma stoltei]
MSKLMKAAILESISENPQVAIREVPIPTPGPGEVLIRMEAAPINPSDLLFIRGLYGNSNPVLPIVPGFEGSGIVIQNGGGFIGWTLLGKRVACAMTPKMGGTWAEYMVTSAKHCVKLNDQITFDQGACFFVNPMTAVMFADVIYQGKHKAAIHTAAASQLGKMMVRWSVENNYPIINIVRRQEQVETLKNLGAKFVLNSSEPTFEEELRALAKELNATIAFDAIGGNITGTLLNLMPETSIVYLYGALSLEACGNINPVGLICEKKKLEGLWLTDWLQSKNIFGAINTVRKVQNSLGELYRTDFAGEYPLEGVQEAIQRYSNNMSAGKILIKPSKGS